MAELIWKTIKEKYKGRDISAECARDGAYVRVRLPGGVEERMKRNKHRADGVARDLLLQMAADGKVLA